MMGQLRGGRVEAAAAAAVFAAVAAAAAVTAASVLCVWSQEVACIEKKGGEERRIDKSERERQSDQFRISQKMNSYLGYMSGKYLVA